MPKFFRRNFFGLIIMLFRSLYLIQSYVPVRAVFNVQIKLHLILKSAKKLKKKCLNSFIFV